MIICCCRGIAILRQRLTLNSHFSSLSTASKVPAGALFLGRGASDQLGGGGIEEKRLYPSQATPLLFCSLQSLANLLTMTTNREWSRWAFLASCFIRQFLLIVFFGYGAKGVEAVLALYMRILLFFLLNLFLESVHSIALGGSRSVPSLPLARFLRGAMVVSVRWGILCILENCSLDWCILLPSLTQVFILFLDLCKQVATFGASQLQFIYA